MYICLLKIILIGVHALALPPLKFINCPDIRRQDFFSSHTRITLGLVY